MNDHSSQNNKNNYNSYLRFSSVAIQMGVIITAGALGGQWLDEQISIDFPVFTLVLSLLAVGISLYLVIKEVMNQSKDDD